MSIIDTLLERAKASPRHIVLSEGEDERIIEGGIRAANDGIAEITILSHEKGLKDRVAKMLTPQALPVHVINPAQSALLGEFAACYHQKRKHKGVDETRAAQAVRDPLNFAAMMVNRNLADGTLGGATHTTGDTVRTALQIIGVSDRYKTVSSFFIMQINKTAETDEKTLLFADCAIVIEPDIEQLASIAVASADSCAEFLGIEPKVALLSFSTHASASHPDAEKVAAATKMAQEMRPNFIIDGEMQLDAAIVPSVSRIKTPGSPLAGQANVLIFPRLEAGNIGYKLVQRLAGATAIGPVLQGLAQPANDLSRGCDANDVYCMIAMTGLQAAAKKTS